MLSEIYFNKSTPNPVLESLALAHFFFKKDEEFKSIKQNIILQSRPVKKLQNSELYQTIFNNKTIKKTFRVNVLPATINLYPEENITMITYLYVNLTAELKSSTNINEISFKHLKIFPYSKKMIKTFLEIIPKYASTKIYCKSKAMLQGKSQNCIRYLFEDKCSFNILENFFGHYQNEIFFGFCENYKSNFD